MYENWDNKPKSTDKIEFRMDRCQYRKLTIANWMLMLIDIAAPSSAQQQIQLARLANKYYRKPLQFTTIYTAILNRMHRIVIQASKTTAP